ncbi:hypothetical protein ACFO3J_24155 [Streptomyces polygonati]|uniref:ATP-grasp-modified RiPP n=1 Tax=Streptomyces polygonati TaxID=1617087 RepID=A0ABV8HR83_9ACTN
MAHGTETIYVLGEGGGVHPMDMPLPEPIEERLRKGMLVRVNQDGSPYAPPAELDGGSAPPAPPLTEPAKSASKPDWVGWAVVRGATAEEADGMTKADLIEKYASPTNP